MTMNETKNEYGGDGQTPLTCVRCGEKARLRDTAMVFKKGWAEPSLYDSDPQEADVVVCGSLCPQCFREALELAVNGSTMVEEFDVGPTFTLSERTRKQTRAHAVSLLGDIEETIEDSLPKAEALLQVVIEIIHGDLHASVLEEI